jgi:hypothetical protein
MVWLGCADAGACRQPLVVNQRAMILTTLKHTAWRRVVARRLGGGSFLDNACIVLRPLNAMEAYGGSDNHVLMTDVPQTAIAQKVDKPQHEVLGATPTLPILVDQSALGRPRMLACANRTGILGTSSGLYRRRNGGRAWRSVDMPVRELGVQGVAIARGADNVLRGFAGTEAHGLSPSAVGDHVAARRGPGAQQR